VVGHGGVSDGGPLHERGGSQRRVVLGGQGARVCYVHSGGQQVMLQVGRGWIAWPVDINLAYIGVHVCGVRHTNE